jgi:hypothetical protein
MNSEYLNKRSHSTKYPSACSKPHCNGNHFIRHEDGWQCLNCMKIIYRYPPLPYIQNNHPERVGPYNYKSSPEMKECGSNNGYLDSINPNQKYDSELRDVESITVLENDLWDWAPDLSELPAISGIYKSPPL